MSWFFILSPFSAAMKTLDKVKLNAGQRCANLMHHTAHSKRSEVNGDQSGAVDQLNYTLFSFCIVTRCKKDGARFVGRKVLYPRHRHVADGFYESGTNGHLGDNLARGAPL